jgi:L-glyceraldehyde 3-phosphate reductase
MSYRPTENRYELMPYARTGRSGLKLPKISLGLWHNFGGVDVHHNSVAMLTRAFDLGITHFDLANNYGPPAGSAETTLGRVLKNELRGYRDELVISTKAGWGMWPGPYGDEGSRKYLIASLDQSLKRLGIDYVDIFYHHRPDPETPLEETMGALDQIVRSGKALYVGISSYSAEQTKAAAAMLRQLGTPCLIHQPSYSIFNRWVEDGLLDELRAQKMGAIVFSPLAQGLLTSRYLQDIPADSRAAKDHGFLERRDITETRLGQIRDLNQVAQERGQTLAQLAISWVLRDPVVTSALIGASKVSQVEDCAQAATHTSFSQEELKRIDEIAARG